MIAKVNFDRGEIEWEFKNFAEEIKSIGKISWFDQETGIIQAEKGFARMDVNTGKVRWVLPGLENFGPMNDHTQWITGNGYYAVKIDPERGGIVWRLDFQAEGLKGRSLLFHDSIIHNDSKSLARIDLDRGAIKWSMDVPSELGRVDSNTLGISREGVVKCEHGLLRIDRETGEMLWKSVGMDEKFGRHFGYSNEGFVGDFTTKKVGKIDLKTGEILWEREDLPIEFKTLAPNFVRGSHGARFLATRGVAKMDEQGNVLFKTTDIPQDKIDTLKQLGIEWYERFYSLEFIEHIIKNRNVLEQGNAAELQKKPMTVVFFPRRDENRSYLHNNLDEFMKSSNVLYFEVENEQEMYKELSKLQALGIRVTTLVMGGHSTHDHMSFGDKDPAQSKDLNEQLVLDFSDESELSQYASLFKGATLLSTGCSTGEGGGKQDTLVDLFARTLGKESVQIVGAQLPVNSYLRFDEKGNFVEMEFFDFDEEKLTSEEIYVIQR